MSGDRCTQSDSLRDGTRRCGHAAITVATYSTIVLFCRERNAVIQDGSS